jgi:hypothetical protein
MAPPKTYRNISMNVTGWMVDSSSTSGRRTLPSRLRRVMTPVCATARPRRRGVAVTAMLTVAPHTAAAS